MSYCDYEKLLGLVPNLLPQNWILNWMICKIGLKLETKGSKLKMSHLRKYKVLHH